MPRRNRNAAPPVAGETSNDRRLTPKQARFAELYSGPAAGNGAKSYRLAYDAAKSSPETCAREAARLLADPRIMLRIELLRAEASERTQHSLDTVLIEVQGVIARAISRGAGKVAVDAITLKARLLGLLGRPGVAASTADALAGIGAVDFSKWTLADLIGLQAQIDHGQRRAAAIASDGLTRH